MTPHVHHSFIVSATSRLCPVTYWQHRPSHLSTYYSHVPLSTRQFLCHTSLKMISSNSSICSLFIGDFCVRFFITRKRRCTIFDCLHRFTSSFLKLPFQFLYYGTASHDVACKQTPCDSSQHMHNQVKQIGNQCELLMLPYSN